MRWLFWFGLSALLVCGHRVEAQTLVLRFEGKLNDSAPIFIELTDAQQKIALRKAERHTQGRIELKGVGHGRYALRVFQDLNGNGKLDTGWMGIPKEPYGFSNNAMGRMGPPALEDLWFDFAEGTVLKIRLR